VQIVRWFYQRMRAYLYRLGLSKLLSPPFVSCLDVQVLISPSAAPVAFMRLEYHRVLLLDTAASKKLDDNQDAPIKFHLQLADQHHAVVDMASNSSKFEHSKGQADNKTEGDIHDQPCYIPFCRHLIHHSNLCDLFLCS
jgi:hypothetical protein